MSLGHSTFPQIKILIEVNLFGIHKKQKKEKRKKRNPNIWKLLGQANLTHSFCYFATTESSSAATK